jgi:hypothetical protein
VRSQFLRRTFGALPRFSTDPQYANWRLKFLRHFDPQDPEVLAQSKTKLPNGAQSFLVPNPELPIKDGFVNFAITDGDQRNTPPLFGLGLIESIPQTAIDEVAQAQPPIIRGRSPPLKEGGFGRFGWKSSTGSLREFNENACAVELGLTTPNFAPVLFRAADFPLDSPAEGMIGTYGSVPTLVRFAPSLPFAPALPAGPSLAPAPLVSPGFVPALPANPPLVRAPPPLPAPPAPRGTPDMSAFDVAALTHFVASLPAPRQVVDPARQAQIAEGERHFHAVGCATCHPPNLGGVTGICSDLLLHRIGLTGGASFYGRSPPPVPPVPDIVAKPDPTIVAADEFRTPPLWGVADSAPYLHDGSAPNLEEAIYMHKEQAAEVTRAFDTRLNSVERQTVLTFLESLRAPQ